MNASPGELFNSGAVPCAVYASIARQSKGERIGDDSGFEQNTRFCSSDPVALCRMKAEVFVIDPVYRHAQAPAHFQNHIAE